MQSKRHISCLVRGSARHFSEKKSGAGLPNLPTLPNLKRFYKHVDVIEHPLGKDLPKLPADEEVSLNNLSLSHDKYYAITLDGRVVKTLFKDTLAIPSKALAVAIAEEWEQQHERIDLRTMFLTQWMTKGVRMS